MKNKFTEGIIVLSLFDGMSCAHLALDKLGIKVKAYYASEIDKYAIQVTMANYPDTIQLGDVTKIKGSDLPKVDLIIGGSPCQGFSFAGKQLNFNDPRSKLFFEYARILEELREVNPEIKFFLENVQMKQEYKNVISKLLGVNPVEINSALLSAQNRERCYWTNIGMVPAGLFGDMESIITQPKDKGIYLKDILQPEEEVHEKYYLSDKMLAYLNNRKANFNNGKINYKNIEEKEKASCINASSGHIDISDNLICQQGVVNDHGVMKDVDKSLIIDANYHKGMDRHGQRTMVALREVRSDEGREQRKKNMAEGRDSTPFRSKVLEPREDGKIGCLATGATNDNLILIQVGSLYQNNASAGRIYSVEGKGCTLKGEGGGGGAKMGLILVETDNPIIHQRGRGHNKGGEHTKKSPPLTSNSWDRNHSLERRVTVFAADHRNDEGIRIRENGKAPTLTSGSKNSGTQLNSLAIIQKVEKRRLVIQLSDNKESGGVQPYQQNRVYDVDGIAPALHTDERTHAVYIKERIRRLTPIECERLQTVPDNYTNHVSDTQRYRMLGNGYTVDVIAYILSYEKSWCS